MYVCVRRIRIKRDTLLYVSLTVCGGLGFGVGVGVGFGFGHGVSGSRAEHGRADGFFMSHKQIGSWYRRMGSWGFGYCEHDEGGRGTDVVIHRL